MNEEDSTGSSGRKENCILLSSTEQGDTVTLVAVEGGRSMKARLASMGLLPGVEMEILKKNNGGPLVVCVKESRVMLGRGMAHKITVK